jgi:para-aminobenzoate synthetase/4-amino-4-deoxychorismate lyase
MAGSHRYVSPVLDPSQPFLLLDDAASGSARLLTGVQEAISVTDHAAVAGALARLAEPGAWGGFVGFEAGYALEARLHALQRPPPPGQPLAWLARFARDEAVDAAALLADWQARPAKIGPVMPAVGAADHAAAQMRVQQLIASGDIYQANLTFPAEVAVHGHPISLYARLRAGSAAPFGALLFTGDLWLLSLSPELFFRLDGRRLTARPMKGTAKRGRFAAEDQARRAELAASPKNRAENLMITDLIRNDLSRVADNVEVPALFELEAYPTVWQMTSTVTATAKPGVMAADVLAALFPCGSVTGAPKIRSMEVLAEVEPAPRGAYCGAIGAISANGDVLFNVAIRTLALPVGGNTAQARLGHARLGHAGLGLGSGIVADSVAADEWAECLAKAAFLHRRALPDLIETMRVEAGTLPDLTLHLDRLAASAAHLGHRFDRAALESALLGAVVGHTGRARLLLAPSGAWSLHLSPPPLPLPDLLLAALVPLPVAGDDWRLCHKTSDRAFYDEARRAAGAAEVIFVRPDGLVTEGSFTSLFVKRGGRLLTPPADLGLLPGILRARLIAEGRAVEALLTPADLVSGFLVGNALRGLIPAVLRQ